MKSMKALALVISFNEEDLAKFAGNKIVCNNRRINKI